MYNKERKIWLLQNDINKALEHIDYLYYAGVEPSNELIELVDSLIDKMEKLQLKLRKKGRNAK